MWSVLCNYIYEKLFFKSTAGQKRKNEEWTEYPPMKQIKLDVRDRYNFGCSSHEFTGIMKKEENCYDDENEEEEEVCITNEIFPKKWGSSCTMARQPIHRAKYSLTSSIPLDNMKLNSNTNNQILKQPLYKPSNVGEVEVVKYVIKNSSQNSGKGLKSKPPHDRIFNSYQSSNSRPSMDKLKSSAFQSNLKKSLNFLQESYRLSEKVQYMQLLQQQTTKLNSLLAPFTIQRVGSQRGSKSSIPVIDLTKEKNNVVINRSRENIPWTSSSKSNDDVTFLDSDFKKPQVTRINTLQDILKTHPVTEKDIVDEILSHHSSETAQKRRQVEIEAAKLEALNATNRKAYNDALEEKMRDYMRITTPALEELEPDKEEYMLPDLTIEQESKISSVYKSTTTSDVIVEKFGLQIKGRDLHTLKGLNWLNDEIINFYMNLIMERGKGDSLPNVYAFNTFFYPKLLSGGHSSLKRWTKKIDIFSQDMILVPVHLGLHWCMALIDFRSKEVKYYDSMGSSNNRCLEALLSYLEDESLDKKKKPYNTNDWEKINVKGIPQQMNGSDCGVFSCTFAEHLARDCPLLFSQCHMPYFRRKITLEIMEAKLLT